LDSGIKKIVYIIIIFGFLAIGIEAMRYIKIYIALESSIESIAADSIELSILDEYREDHVSIMDIDVCKNTFVNQIKSCYSLDASLNPPDDSYIKKFVVQKLDLEPGEYTLGLNSLEQTKEPSLYIKGYISIKPMVLGVNTMVNVPFELHSKNARR
jgi:hypothetical protein